MNLGKFRSKYEKNLEEKLVVLVYKKDTEKDKFTRVVLLGNEYKYFVHLYNYDTCEKNWKIFIKTFSNMRESLFFITEYVESYYVMYEKFESLQERVSK